MLFKLQFLFCILPLMQHFHAKGFFIYSVLHDDSACWACFATLLIFPGLLRAIPAHLAALEHATQALQNHLLNHENDLKHHPQSFVFLRATSFICREIQTRDQQYLVLVGIGLQAGIGIGIGIDILIFQVLVLTFCNFEVLVLVLVLTFLSGNTNTKLMAQKRSKNPVFMCKSSEILHCLALFHHI